MPRKKKTKRGTRKKSSRKAIRRAPMRTVAKKVVAKKPIAISKSAQPFAKRRVNIVLKNLILFVILCILSVVIASVSTNAIVDELFWILAMLTGFVAVALLIVLLVFLFMKTMKK